VVIGERSRLIWKIPSVSQDSRAVHSYTYNIAQVRMLVSRPELPCSSWASGQRVHGWTML